MTDLIDQLRAVADTPTPFVSLQHDAESFADALAAGLSLNPPRLPTHFLYDEKGSALFEEITRQPEYYPTRTEAAILAEHAASIRELTGDVSLVELGSGYSVKTQHLLRAYGDVGYHPIEVSASALDSAHEAIARDWPEVEFAGVHGTLEDALPQLAPMTPKMVVWLGSSIGNLYPHEIETFWSENAASLAPGDFFLLGIDLVKDPDVLQAAYNDAAGVTEAFTLNFFARMNRELGTELDLTTLEHEARWSPGLERIVTKVRFRAPQTIRLDEPALEHNVPADGRLLVEISQKFHVDAVADQVARHGLTARGVFQDPKGWFALMLLQRED